MVNAESGEELERSWRRNIFYPFLRQKEGYVPEELEELKEKIDRIDGELTDEDIEDLEEIVGDLHADLDDEPRRKLSPKSSPKNPLGYPKSAPINPLGGQDLPHGGM